MSQKISVQKSVQAQMSEIFEKHLSLSVRSLILEAYDRNYDNIFVGFEKELKP